jgi:hypothetical protein
MILKRPWFATYPRRIHPNKQNGDSDEEKDDNPNLDDSSLSRSRRGEAGRLCMGLVFGF